MKWRRKTGVTEWFVSSAVLAAALIALRYALQGKISPKLQYGLWALLLIRLLVPVSVGQSDVSVENLVPAAEHRVLYLAQRTAQPALQAEAAEQAAAQSVSEKSEEPEAAGTAAGTVDLKKVLRTVWLCGAAGVFCWFLGCELVCRRHLRRCARQVSAARRGFPAVFVSPAAGSPCLFGLLRPAIYLTPETDADETARRHCLAHEQTHYRHGDHIWPALRCVCLALHWFDPLVWWAAALSRTDAELACDEDAVRSLGEAERTAYGRTLLQMTCRGHVSLLSAAMSMSGKGSQIRARIRAIAKPVKPALPALLAAVLFAVLAAGCTMTGGVPQEVPASEVEPPEALIKARVEDAEPADEQLNALLEKAGASVLSDSEQAAFCSYLLDNFDELEGRGVLNAESRWTAERLSDTVACLTIYRPDAQDEVLDELIYHRETGLVSDTRFRCYQASVGDDAPENVRTYTYNALLSSVYQKIPFECFANYLDGHYRELSPLGLWSYDTVWSISMTEREMRLTISGLPGGGSEAFLLDLDTMLVRREETDTQRAIFAQWFDFAVQWRLDKLPVFWSDETAEDENHGLPDGASAYLTWLYAVNQETLDAQGSIDPDWAYANIAKYFPIRRLSFDDLPDVWEFKDGGYSLGHADAGWKPLVRLDSLEADVLDGETVYTMQLTFLTAEHPVEDAEWDALRAQILSGDETGLLESHIDTYRFRFSGGEPYFLEHNELMICR